mgnify:CR=1 FL=1
MAYVLIPDGFVLKKVTKAEKDAVDEHFGRERRGSYFENFLGNTNTPIVLGGFLATYLALKEGEKLVDGLIEEGFSLSHELQKGIKDTKRKASKELITDPINWLVAGIENLDLPDISVPGGILTGLRK